MAAADKEDSVSGWNRIGSMTGSLIQVIAICSNVDVAAIDGVGSTVRKRSLRHGSPDNA
jgi:hypothetical protein